MRTKIKMQTLSRSQDSADSDASFMKAWEGRLVPFPTTAGHIRRVRQILKATYRDASLEVLYLHSQRELTYNEF